MSGKIRVFIMGGLLLMYVLSGTGCAAAWFLAGAGAAGTVASVVYEREKAQVQEETAEREFEGEEFDEEIK
ncbi:MAG: hypothetical protein DRP85_06210 [Candidatus Makaraimicrobium thalassicum]|nr:MAG: hypothetical protein DRP85_06210 [Candidatus Omnitrophota bacterium]